MNLFATLKDLRGKKADLVAKADASTDVSEIRDINAQLKALNDEIGVWEQFREATEGDLTPEPDSPKPAAFGDSKLDALLKSDEYKAAFFDAFRSGASVKNMAGDGRHNILMDALTETGGTPAGSEGGFLLPVDFDNKIWELRRKYVALTDHVTVEEVTAFSGWRAREKNANRAVFAKLTELQAAPDAASPLFSRIDYTVSEYGGTIPVSNALMQDTPVNIMEYLGRWLARTSINTENAAILALLDGLTPLEWDIADRDRPLKEALNVLLDPSISATAIVLTNQSGFNSLDQMEDDNGRALLQPDPASPTKLMYKGRDIVVMSNAALPNTVDGESPVYVGDFAEFVHFFRRKAFEVAATNVGAGAFEKRVTMVLGLERFDVKTIDEGAAVKLLLSDGSVTP